MWCHKRTYLFSSVTWEHNYVLLPRTIIKRWRQEQAEIRERIDVRGWLMAINGYKNDIGVKVDVVKRIHSKWKWLGNREGNSNLGLEFMSFKAQNTGKTPKTANSLTAFI